MAVVAVTVFLLMHAGTSDPAAVIAGESASPEEIERIRVQLGLHLPVHRQFLVWLSHLLTGDLGVSIYSKLPVTRLIAQRLEPTLMLAITTMTLAVFLAVPLGVVAGWKARTWIDRAVMVFAVLAFSFPVFLIGYLMIFGLSLKLSLFPVQGYVSISKGVLPFLRHITLPAVALGSIYAALIARITRASMIEVLREDYVRTAFAKGVPRMRVLLRHALRNASVPIVTIIGVGAALLISGVVVTESVFSIPGLGRLTADAILHRDYPVIQGIVLFFSFNYVILNLIVDILYTVLDPRIRY
jgi:peptide/nickel transport system permease protein